MSKYLRSSYDFNTNAVTQALVLQKIQDFAIAPAEPVGYVV